MSYASPCPNTFILKCLGRFSSHVLHMFWQSKLEGWWIMFQIFPFVVYAMHHSCMHVIRSYSKQKYIKKGIFAAFATPERTEKQLSSTSWERKLHFLITETQQQTKRVQGNQALKWIILFEFKYACAVLIHVFALHIKERKESKWLLFFLFWWTAGSSLGLTVISQSISKYKMEIVSEIYEEELKRSISDTLVQFEASLLDIKSL